MKDYIDRFDRYTTSLQVLHNSDVKGKVFMVTGSSNGIGFETARNLCLHGAKVILCGSSTKSVTDAVMRLKCGQFDAQIYHVVLNLESLKDVQKAATEVIENFTKLDGLILNAGIAATKEGIEMTEDGFEKVFQINFLSQFYLTLLIQDLLKKESRVVIVSSNFYKNSKLTLNNISPNFFQTSSSLLYGSYATSKLLNILHARELSRQLSSKGVLVFSSHPGVVWTRMYSGWLSNIAYYFWKIKTLSQGAASVLYAAVSKDIVNHSGSYIVDCKLFKPITPAAIDDTLARAVWELAIDMLKKSGCILP